MAHRLGTYLTTTTPQMWQYRGVGVGWESEYEVPSLIDDLNHERKHRDRELDIQTDTHTY